MPAPPHEPAAAVLRRLGTAALLVLGLAASGCAVSAPAGESLAERRQRMAGMGPEHKAELAQALDRFQALDPDECERLRCLNRQIENDPDADGLRDVMRRYYEWFKKLPLYRRAELVELAPDERIARVKKMQQEEEDRALRCPDPADIEGLLAWMNQYAARHEAQVLQTLPKSRREEESKAPADHRRRVVQSILWTRGPGKRGNLPPLADTDLADVRAQLSPATRACLESKPPEDQWRLIASWARYLIHFQGDPRKAAGLPEISEAELLHFFEYELTPEQRDSLLALPADEMQRQLRRLYYRIKLPRTPSHGLGPLEPRWLHPRSTSPKKSRDKPRKGTRSAAPSKSDGG